jgi:hypothetical protein
MPFSTDGKNLMLNAWGVASASISGGSHVAALGPILGVVGLSLSVGMKLE